MNAAEFVQFTQALQDVLHSRPEVLGLILLGSTAGTHQQPDAHSDHDFFVIVPDAYTEAYRSGVEWLPPRHVPFVHHFRNTLHGARVIYADGHLLEYAVFTPDELALSRNHHARIVFDRLGDLPGRLAATLRPPAVRLEAVLSDVYAHLLIGLEKYGRGENLAAYQFIHTIAAHNVLELLQLVTPSSKPELIDPFNPWRRVEQTHPVQAQAIAQALRLDTPQAAQALLDLAREIAGQHWDGQTAQAVQERVNPAEV